MSRENRRPAVHRTGNPDALSRVEPPITVRAAMRPVLSFALATLALAATPLLGAGCGSEIGDSCAVNLDCDPSNSRDRVCDLSSTGGYCTIIGCDHKSCPEGSVCIRFYVASFANAPCNFATEDVGGTNDCAPDEVCAFTGQCVPSTSEVRYCMKTCESQGDCRDEYECRNEELMRANGGEPVPPPGERIGGDLPAFCAEAPRAES
jgi:hypothetical protein